MPIEEELPIKPLQVNERNGNLRILDTLDDTLVPISQSKVKLNTVATKKSKLNFLSRMRCFRPQSSEENPLINQNQLQLQQQQLKQHQLHGSIRNLNHYTEMNPSNIRLKDITINPLPQSPHPHHNKPSQMHKSQSVTHLKHIVTNIDKTNKGVDTNRKNMKNKTEHHLSQSNPQLFNVTLTKRL
jgi:hypothetical protein